MPRKRKPRHRIDPRNLKYVRELAKGKGKREALKAAGLSYKNPSQSGAHAMKQVEKYMPAALTKYGLNPDSLVKDLLKPLCYAKETKFFPYRVTEVVEPARVVTDENGKPLFDAQGNAIIVPAVERTVQKIDTREVISWGARRDGLDMALRVGGYYPSPSAADPLTQIGVKVIMVGVPRPGDPPLVAETSTNGHNAEGNGQ